MHRYRIHRQQWGQADILGENVRLSDWLGWCLLCCRMLHPLSAHTLRFWQMYRFLSLKIWEDMNNRTILFLIDANLQCTWLKSVPGIFHYTSLGIWFKIYVYIFIFFFLNIFYGWWLSLTPNPNMLNFPHNRNRIYPFFFFFFLMLSLRK